MRERVLLCRPQRLPVETPAGLSLRPIAMQNRMEARSRANHEPQLKPKAQRPRVASRPARLKALRAMTKVALWER
jgi:hypothetical protein